MNFTIHLDISRNVTLTQINANDRRNQVVHAARLMIKRYGRGATVEAGIRCAELIELDDQDAVNLWLDISREIRAQLHPQ